MNQELIEILTCIRTWSFKKEGACKGSYRELGLANNMKCGYHCEYCAVLQSSGNKIYSNQIVSIPLN